MTKISLFNANVSQVVDVNQIVYFYGVSYKTFVVYEIENDNDKIFYKLIDTETFDFMTVDLILPLSQKFGVGYYYNDNKIELISPESAVEILMQANDKAEADVQKQEEIKQISNELKEKGRIWIEKNFPSDAKAVIVGKLRKDESDTQQDYSGHRTLKTIILGFSKHTRDLFSEMRKYASNCKETAFLAENEPKYEHRERYTGGGGYYLGKNYHSGWIIEKEKIHSLESFINRYAEIIGNPDNIFINLPQTIEKGSIKNDNTEIKNLNIEVIDYTEKSFVLVGDTKPLKEFLAKELKGAYNRYLNINGEKTPGWIFPKKRKEEVLDALEKKQTIKRL